MRGALHLSVALGWVAPGCTGPSDKPSTQDTGLPPPSETGPAVESGLDDSQPPVDSDSGAAEEGPALHLSEAYATLVGEYAKDRAGAAVSWVGDTNGDGREDLAVGAPGHGQYFYPGAVYLITSTIIGVSSLYTADAALLGADEWAVAGFGVAGLGDVDGDGYDDISILSLGDYDTQLVLGPISGVSSLTDADATLVIDTNLSGRGHVMAAGSDLDGDGWKSLAVGVPAWDGHGAFSGAVYVVEGPLAGEVALSTAAATIEGEADLLLGWAIENPGDLDGDGLDDLMVAGPGAGRAEGAVMLWYAPLSGVITWDAADVRLDGAEEDELAGGALAAPGDTDGDGVPDLLIGAGAREEPSGLAYLVPGAGLTSQSLNAVASRVEGGEGFAMAGGDIAGPGDLNLDGCSDLVIGGYGTSDDDQDVTVALLIYSPLDGVRDATSADLRLVHHEEGASWGNAAGVGDVDGDGRRDLLVGADGDDLGAEDAGAAYLLLGSQL